MMDKTCKRKGTHDAQFSRLEKIQSFESLVVFSIYILGKLLLKVKFLGLFSTVL